MTQIVELFTDGACSGNPGPGGWGAILRHGKTEKELSGGAMNTTNNRMEMMAVIEGLKALKKPCAVKVVTDSTYVKKGIEEWLESWKAKDYKKVKNRDLWEEIDQLIQYHNVTVQWVKGHSGHPENERADQLAVAAVPVV